MEEKKKKADWTVVGISLGICAVVVGAVTFGLYCLGKAEEARKA